MQNPADWMPPCLASCLCQPTGPSDSDGQALEGPKLRIGTNGFLKRLLDQGKERRETERKTFSSNKGGGFTNTLSIVYS